MLSNSSISSGIYRITCIPTGRFYVGSALRVVKRWGEHRFQLNRGTHCNRKLQNAWNKYGPDSFALDVLEYVEDSAKLIEREQHFIDTLHAHHRKSGFNLDPTAGSPLGRKCSAASIEKTAAAHRGVKRSPETKARISAARASKPLSEKQRAVVAKMTEGNRGKRRKGVKGRPVSDKQLQALLNNRAKTPSPECLAKAWAASRDRIPTADERAKMSAAQRGRVHSPASIEKTAAAHRGMKRSAEARAKMTQAQLERWRRYRATVTE
jgi:group I intron endonuclease